MGYMNRVIEAYRVIRVNRWFRDSLFIIHFLVLFFYYDLDKFISEPPQGLHIWRQTDCLSITRNYFDHDARFAEPEIHNLISDNNTTGKTAGEFPLLYWSVAKLWKVTGMHESLYRIIGLLFSLSGLFAVYRICLRLTGRAILSVIAGLLLFTSPVFVNYSVSFLPNTVALSLALAGWALFYRFTIKSKIRLLWISVMLFALAMLLKVSAGISFVALTGWFIIEPLLSKGERPVTRARLNRFLPLIIGWAAVAAWYIYAEKYNTIHGGRYTFNNIWPIWQIPGAERREILSAARILWKDEIFLRWIAWLSVAIWPILLLSFRKLPVFARYLLIVIPLGTIIYMLLWFQALRDHDYYLIDLLLPLLLNWIMLFYLVARTGTWQSMAASTVAVMILLASAKNCNNSLQERSQGWMNSWYINNLETVYEVGKDLESRGIPPDAIIISIPDPSINSTLYMLNRRGFTDFGSDFSQPGMIGDRIDKGAGFLIINDTTLLTNERIKPYLDYKIFSKKNVSAFDLRPYR